MVGLNPLTSSTIADKDDSHLDISNYHEKILRLVVEDFVRRGFKYVSCLPGGFKECHDACTQLGLQMHNHDKPSECYHCNETVQKGTQRYN